MKKLLFIFNPVSGRTKIRNKLYNIVDFYTKSDYIVTVYPTQNSNDRKNLLLHLQDSYDLIVCSGGDGTLHEIISGILESGTHKKIGYIPSGSTNDFSRNWGIPQNIDKSLLITTTGVVKDIDIGELNELYFVYVAAFGVFSKASYSAPQKAKNILGYMAYILAGIKALSELRTYKLILEHDYGVIDGTFIVGLITNTFSVAGIKVPCHSLIQLNDGLFEILLIRVPQNLMELQEIILSLRADDIKSKHIVWIQSTKIKIYSELMEWTLDGEYGGTFSEVSINILPSRFKIIVPQ